METKSRVRDLYGARPGTMAGWRVKAINELLEAAHTNRQVAKKYRKAAENVPRLVVSIGGIQRPRLTPLHKAKLFDEVADVYEEWARKIREEI